jgi:hypothetical protein
VSANIDWDWLAPTRCDPPYCTIAQLSDGTYTFDDLADMHEAMAEEAEYHRRREDALEAKREAEKETR